MQFGIVTLFPTMFQALNSGITSRAIKEKILKLDFYNPRDFTSDVHKTVDDRPYGGGPGMVMKVEPILAALAQAQANLTPAQVICMSPQGKRVTQQDIVQLATAGTNTIFIAGRYEGIDQRVYELAVDAEWSIGDYVLSGGELAIMVVIDAITRLLPGALGDATSVERESFTDNLLDCPHYTRPEQIANLKVPEVLLSGDHLAINKWRLQQQLGRTYLLRPDLLAARQLGQEEQNLLTEFLKARGEVDE